MLSTCDNLSPVTVHGTACWQVNHAKGFLLGCKLPDYQGRRFAGLYDAHTCPSLDTSHISSQRQELHRSSNWSSIESDDPLDDAE